MAIALIERPSVSRPAHPRRRRVAALLATGALGVVLVGFGGYRAVEADGGPSTPDGWEAWTMRLEAEADAYFADQANLARGRAADSARLQAAADASLRAAP